MKSKHCRGVYSKPDLITPAFSDSHSWKIVSQHGYITKGCRVFSCEDADLQVKLRKLRKIACSYMSLLRACLELAFPQAC